MVDAPDSGSGAASAAANVDAVGSAGANTTATASRDLVIVKPCAISWSATDASAAVSSRDGIDVGPFSLSVSPFTVAVGTTCVIIGHVGSGKTTLLHGILGEAVITPLRAPPSPGELAWASVVNWSFAVSRARFLCVLACRGSRCRLRSHLMMSCSRFLCHSCTFVVPLCS